MHHILRRFHGTSYCFILGTGEGLQRLVQGEVVFREENPRQKIRGLIGKYGYPEDLSLKAEPKREELRNKESLDVLRSCRGIAEGWS